MAFEIAGYEMWHLERLDIGWIKGIRGKQETGYRVNDIREDMRSRLKLRRSHRTSMNVEENKHKKMRSKTLHA
jgi:hypothetical protein